jgi:hypothetical protein
MNALATPLARSNRDDVRSTPDLETTNGTLILEGSVSEEATTATTPETESLILLIATPKSRREASAFFFGASPLRVLVSSLELKLVLFFGICVPLLVSLRLGRGNASRAMRSERIDDDCRKPKINHVFHRIGRGQGNKLLRKKTGGTGVWSRLGNTLGRQM